MINLKLLLFRVEKTVKSWRISPFYQGLCQYVREDAISPLIPDSFLDLSKDLKQLPWGRTRSIDKIVLEPAKADDPLNLAKLFVLGLEGKFKLLVVERNRRVADYKEGCSEEEERR